MSDYNSGLNPLWDNVVVELDAQRESKRGDLYIPETAEDKNKPMQGTIKAIGSGNKGKDDVDMSVLTVGSRVLVRQYAGTTFERDGKKYLVLRANDVMCEVIS